MVHEVQIGWQVPTLRVPLEVPSTLLTGLPRVPVWEQAQQCSRHRHPASQEGCTPYPPAQQGWEHVGENLTLFQCLLWPGLAWRGAERRGGLHTSNPAMKSEASFSRQNKTS